jgi:hypothetical protein
MQLTIPVFDSLSLERKIVKQTLDFQILLLEQAQFDDALSKESVNLFKKNVRSAKEVNKFFLQQHLRFLDEIEND